MSHGRDLVAIENVLYRVEGIFIVSHEPPIHTSLKDQTYFMFEEEY